MLGKGRGRYAIREREGMVGKLGKERGRKVSWGREVS